MRRRLPRWHLGGSGVFTSTRLRFNHGPDGDERRSAALLDLAYAPTAQVSLRVSVGAGLGGALRMPVGRYAFSAGPIAALGVSYQLVQEAPFVMLTGALSASAATTRAPTPARTHAKKRSTCAWVC